MTRRFAVLAVAALFGAAAYAQAPTADELADRLNISSSTAAVVAEVLAERAMEPGALWSAAAELAGRLTDEQKAELLAARPAERDRRPHLAVRQARASDMVPGFQRLWRELDLTEAQRQQVAELHARHAPQIREAMMDLRKSEADRTTTQQRRRELQSQLLREAQAILTPEQQARVEAAIQELEQDRGARRPTARLREGERPQRRTVKTQFRRADVEQRATHAERQAARDRALDLTEAQRARIEELRDARRAEVRQRAQAQNRERRLRSAEQATDLLSQELTEQQREIVQIHRALARAMAPSTRRR